MNWRSNWKITLVCLLLLFFVFKARNFIVLASQIINATIRLSVCGDKVVEWPEDCEGKDLNSQTCESLGFASGSLTCDIACSFDTTECLTPTPTPSPTTSPTPTPTLIPTSTSTSTPTPTPTGLPTTAPDDETISSVSTPTPTPTPISKIVIIPALPPFLQFFDPNADNQIERHETYQIVSLWVEKWQQTLLIEKESTDKEKKKCDLNLDQWCNLTDLSILLYYVGR